MSTSSRPKPSEPPAVNVARVHWRTFSVMMVETRFLYDGREFLNLMPNITYTGVHDVDAVVDYFMRHDKQLVGNPVFAEAKNVDILKQSLRNLLGSVNNEREFEEMLNFKKLIFEQLVHYSDAIEKMDSLKEDLRELMVHRIYTGTELKLLIWVFGQLYGKAPDLSNKENRAPQGFLRYLKMNCKPDVTAHFLALALRQFVRTEYPDEKLYQDEKFLMQSFNYLCELVMETEDPKTFFETLQKQQEELRWLSEQLKENEQRLAGGEADEELAQQQEKLRLDFMTERLEMDFLARVIIRLF